LQGYDAEGAVFVSETVAIGPGEKKKYEIQNSAFFYSESMSASVVSGKKRLLGYFEFWNNETDASGVDLISAASALERAPLLVMPHAPWNNYWNSGLAVMNTGDETTAVTFTPLDNEGNEAGDTATRFLNPNQKVVYTLGSLFPYVSNGEISSVRIKAENGQPLTGLALYWPSSGMRLAGTLLLPPSGETMILPHAVEGLDWFTGIGLTNAGNNTAAVAFSFYDSGGHLLGFEEKNLGPGEQLVTTMGGIFPSENIGGGGYLKIENIDKNPLSAMYIIGSGDGSKLMGDNLIYRLSE
jgi:hypothetical protein